MKHVEIDNDGVRMTAFRQMRLRHASDLPEDFEECFGGDTLGQWNVSRINRLLDAFDAPVVHLPIPLEIMLSMARVGKPDRARAQLHAVRGLATIPPVSFVSFAGKDGDQRMMVDGHHRMMALYLLRATAVPARILPPSLADDVRVVEMSQAVIFPAPQIPANRFVCEGEAA